MSEFFLELFSEEVPANLQKNTRETLLQNFTDFFEKENISFSEKGISFSTPNRLLIFFEKINKKVVKKTEEIRGPNINATENSVEGFLRSHNIEKKEIFKKKTEKGEFYFYKKLAKKIKTIY
jgi:glycyl-tRNA synthetase beta chain